MAIVKCIYPQLLPGLFLFLQHLEIRAGDGGGSVCTVEESEKEFW